jgi:antitoxin component YwqK of YwqJK toxin-antitoxin module
LISETPYKNGVIEGVLKEWYESGRKKYLKHYKNGMKMVRKHFKETILMALRR